MQITKAIKYIGVKDHTVDLFGGRYRLPNGMAYNSRKNRIKYNKTKKNSIKEHIILAKRKDKSK